MTTSKLAFRDAIRAPLTERTETWKQRHNLAVNAWLDGTASASETVVLDHAKAIHLPTQQRRGAPTDTSCPTSPSP